MPAFVDVHNTDNPKQPFVEMIVGDANAVPYRLLDAGLLDDPGRAKFLLKQMDFTLNGDHGGTNRMNLTILDPSWDSLESLLSSLVTSRQIGIRYGWRSARAIEEDNSQIVQMYVWDWNVDVQPFCGAQIQVQLYDRSVELGAAAANFGFDPNTLISDAISTLIQRIDPTLTPNVTTTVNRLTGIACRANGMTPNAYLRRLLKYARATDSGLSGYEMRLRTEAGRKIMDVIPIHTRGGQTKRNYIVGRDREGEVVGFTVAYQGFKTKARGGERTAALAVDPMTKQLVYTVSTQNEDLTLAPRSQNNPTDTTMVHEVAEHNPDQVAAIAHTNRYDADRDIYSAQLTLIGDPGLDPWDFVRVFIIKGTGGMQPLSVQERAGGASELHQLSGLYRVHNVQHTIVPGSFRTTLSLFRTREFDGPFERGQQIQIPVSTIAGTGSVVASPERLSGS